MWDKEENYKNQVNIQIDKQTNRNMERKCGGEHLGRKTDIKKIKDINSLIKLVKERERERERERGHPLTERQTDWQKTNRQRSIKKKK